MDGRKWEDAAGACRKLRNDKLYYSLTNYYCGHQTKRDWIGWECSTHVIMINAR
jgi:hypothetical protein